MKTVVYLGLGANLGDRESNLIKALEMLAEGVRMEAVSSLYETEPMGYLEQPRFLNIVCRGTTPLEPQRLLALAKKIEGSLGRVASFPNAPRPIDIDILFYGDSAIDTPELVIPHPRIAERAFVLVPLAELAPELAHPLTGHTVKSMLAEVNGREGVVRREWSGAPRWAIGKHPAFPHQPRRPR